MQIVRIQRENVVLQAVVMIEIHFGDGNIVEIVSSRKAQADFICRNRLRQLNQVILSPVCIRSLHYYRILCVSAVRVFPVIIVNRHAGIGCDILGFRKGNVTHLIIIVQRK